MKSAARVYQDGPFVMVDIKNDTQVDMALELSIYRQRLALYKRHQQRKQLAIYVGRIQGLDSMPADTPAERTLPGSQRPRCWYCRMS